MLNDWGSPLLLYAFRDDKMRFFFYSVQYRIFVFPKPSIFVHTCILFMVINSESWLTN